MKLYELTYLISSELSEEEARTFQNKIASLIKEEGILDEIRMPFRRKLAYPIKKQVQAYLAFLNFKINPEGLANLEKKLRAENKILRYLILIKKPVKAGKERRRKSFIPSQAPILTEKKSVPEKEKKVELKEIEKKLEEILG
jgi:small subunit ribosomal protein S6